MLQVALLEQSNQLLGQKLQAIMHGGISGGAALATGRAEESEADVQSHLDDAAQHSDAIRRLKELCTVKQLLSQLAKQSVACAAACLVAAFEQTADEGWQVLNGLCFHRCAAVVLSSAPDKLLMLVSPHCLQAGDYRPASAELLRHASQIAAALHRDGLLRAAMKFSGYQVAVHMLCWVCTGMVAECRVASAPVPGSPPCEAAIALTPALSCFAGCDPFLEMHRQQKWTKCAHMT